MSSLPVRTICAFALATAALAVDVAAGAGARGPVGQFQPAAGDRDGDGLADADDCAPDDPSRPAQSGQDADCDGAVDAQGYSADSSVVTPMATLRAAARRAARVPVVQTRSDDIGPAVVFRPRQAQPLLVFAAAGDMRVSITPTLVDADGRRTTVPHSWSAVARGSAWAFRMRRSGAARIVLSIRLRDVASGALYRATRDL